MGRDKLRAPMRVDSIAILAPVESTALLLFCLPLAFVPLFVALAWRRRELAKSGERPVKAEGGRGRALTGLAIGVCLAVWAVGGLHLWWSKSARVEFRPEGLRVVSHGSLELDREQLIVHRVDVVDFDQRPGFRPVRATRGVDLWGLQSGWFQLSNGSRAFVALHEAEQAVLLPLASGRLALVGVADPEALVAEVRRRYGR